MTFAFRALIIWLAIAVLAIANGALREAVLAPAFGVSTALVMSGLLLSTLIIGVAYLAFPWLQIRRLSRAWVLGSAWLVLTLVFEFSFGLWQGKSWPELLAPYTFKDGNLWLLVLAVTFVAPYIAARLRHLA